MKMYYIISLKHTSKGDSALTFFGPDNNGYTWHKKRAGLYTEEEVDRFTSDENPKVEQSLVDQFWMNAKDFGDEFISVPNNKTVLQVLGLNEKYMKPKKFAGCRMVFINLPVSTL